MQDILIEDFKTEEDGERIHFLKPVNKSIVLERIKRANMNWFAELGLPYSATNPASIEFNNQINPNDNFIRKPNRKQRNVTFAKQLVHYSDDLALKRHTNNNTTIDTTTTTTTTTTITSNGNTLTRDNNLLQTNDRKDISELTSSILIAYHQNSYGDDQSLSPNANDNTTAEPDFKNYIDANCHDGNENDEIMEEIIDDIMDGIECENFIGSDYIGQNVKIPLLQMSEATLETIDETDNEMDVQIDSDFVTHENRSTFHYKYEGEDIQNDTTSHQHNDRADNDNDDDDDDDVDDRDNGDHIDINAENDFGHVVATTSISKENCGNYITEEGGPIREANSNCYHQIHLESFGDGSAAGDIVGEQIKTFPAHTTNNGKGDLIKKGKFLNNMINDRKPAIKTIELSSSSSSTSTTHDNFLPMLKLNSKACCQYKRTQQKLPKYTGYFSEYGLSHEQLVAREKRLQRRRRSIVEQTMKTTEQEIRRMHENERAFTKWLQNKMRYPVNTTRNMFDVKRPFGQHKFNNHIANTKVNRFSKTNE